MTGSAGDWGPCVQCGARTHRYGPGGRSHCTNCRPQARPPDSCTRCQQAGVTRPYLHGGRLCASCCPSQVSGELPPGRQLSAQDRRDAVTHTPDRAYFARVWHLRVLPDLLHERKPAVLAAPAGGMRSVARPCSWCRQPALTTTARGRSVHPTCEGWSDQLDDDALIDLIWSVYDALPIVSHISEDSPWPLRPAPIRNAVTSPGTPP